MENMFQ